MGQIIPSQIQGVKHMGQVIPTQIQIETVAGYCNVKCTMCPISKSIRKEIMSNEMFEKIVKRLVPIRDNINIFTLLGLGETLLDKHTPDKIRIAKDYGFNKDVGVFTNAMALTRDMTTDLLQSGLDVLICSIDGYTKETYESIRVGASLDKVISNIDYFIEQRETANRPVKIIIRFTKQKDNEHECDDFYKYWMGKLKEHDAVFFYDVHNAGDSVDNSAKSVNSDCSFETCSEVYKRMIIFSDGSMGLCCGDQFGHYNVGNILDEDPLVLYNGPVFTEYREEMKKGNISKLELCKNCTVARSIANKKNLFI